MTEKYRFTDFELNFIESSEIPFAIYQFIDRQVVTVALSEGFRRLFGYDDIKSAYLYNDNDMYRDTHPDDRARIADAALRFANDNRPEAKYETVYRSRDRLAGGYNIIHAIGKHVFTDTGVRLAQVWYMNEGSLSADESGSCNVLTETLKKALSDTDITKTSHYDYLTGLPSMTYFFEVVAEKKEAALKNGKILQMIFFDLCRMKFFNHKFGFAEGDRLLRSFARVIARYFGSENSCRIGEDHFAVITGNEDIKKVLNDLFDECRWINGGLSLPVHAGIYLLENEDLGIGYACDRAKLACDSQRNIYSSSFCYYNVAMLENDENRQHIIANIDKAISGGWICVYYQPIIRAVNGRVCDEEALARWIDPVRGFMSPAEFIPVLEDCGLNYKLDLYVLDKVLEKLDRQKKAGLHLVPQSINLSRSDFDSCNIVEEIKKRVDKAGIDRSLITIEITESIIGSDFEFMKEQIDRFRELGFAVWMDDFGSGYSSLDVLQSIKFDLIKFDMRFLQNFDKVQSGKIILTQLMKMATFLGIDTVCEGVEDESQMLFLRETGCSKLQGYYYTKPLPLEKILERYEKGTQIGFENPAESKYFETIGRVNLHDLTVLTEDSGNKFQNFFNMLPMAIIEITGEKISIARSNRSYGDFMERYYGVRVTDSFLGNDSQNAGSAPSYLLSAIRQCCEDENRAFIDIRTNSGATVHYFIRRLAVNPLSGTVAAVVIVLSIKDDDQGTNYANIARALSADYLNFYYVDLRTEDFIEYSSGVGKEDLSIERHGKNFFFESRRDALKYLCPDDCYSFIQVFTKENVVREIDENGTFTLTYRLMKNGEPTYVIMKAVRMSEKDKHIIIGVSNIDSQMKQKEMLSRIDRERTVYTRIAALSGDYICMYTVNTQNWSYFEYSSSGAYEGLGFEKSGDDFFAKAQSDGSRTLYSEDYPRYKELFTKENVMREIEKNGIFILRYRLVIDGKPVPVCLRAALVKENGGSKLIVGVAYSAGEI